MHIYAAELTDDAQHLCAAGHTRIIVCDLV
jgi:hypothetical protein